MKMHTWSAMAMSAAISAVTIPVDSHATRYVAHGTMVSGPAAVRVWVDGGDVFPGYGDVTLRVHADRDCYTSLFLVDTAGFIHVLDIDNGYHDGWIYGGRTYGYRACDLGLDRLDGRGIAYVFAVGSPVPFDYSSYGAAVRVGAFGFRIVGDPFVGCREFYTSLLPATCRWDYVNVSFTRFYVREWVRYPSYLCAGHVRVGDACRTCEPVYASYRCNLASPYDALRPVVRYKDRARFTTDVTHVVRAVERSGRYEPIGEARIDTRTVAKDARRVKSQENVRVVSTSRGIERSVRVEKSRPAYSPVVARETTTNASKQVAYKNHGQQQSKKVVHQKGAATKARQAE
ncbi:MAG TPA: hypothetical protein VF247_02750 [Candidatus Krumholzibacteria bacterium]